MAQLPPVSFQPLAGGLYVHAPPLAPPPAGWQRRKTGGAAPHPPLTPMIVAVSPPPVGAVVYGLYAHAPPLAPPPAGWRRREKGKAPTLLPSAPKPVPPPRPPVPQRTKKTKRGREKPVCMHESGCNNFATVRDKLSGKKLACPKHASEIMTQMEQTELVYK